MSIPFQSAPAPHSVHTRLAIPAAQIGVFIAGSQQGTVNDVWLTGRGGSIDKVR